MREAIGDYLAGNERDEVAFRESLDEREEGVLEHGQPRKAGVQNVKTSYR